ncbi:ArsR family transcriptional regulator [Kocuria rhizophila]|nr:ArsR family transcriptional regulator [Kocuria rhizophila]
MLLQLQQGPSGALEPAAGIGASRQIVSNHLACPARLRVGRAGGAQRGAMVAPEAGPRVGRTCWARTPHRRTGVPVRTPECAAEALP